MIPRREVGLTGQMTPTDDPLGAYRAELRAHCYRMLGSVHDAEDVLQEVAVRAWRGRAAFEGRSSLRTWLHRIASNACLNELERKDRRVLPIDLGPAADPSLPGGTARGEVPWLEPFPTDPEEHVAEAESIELAFVAAVQHLAPNQRAALIMFDVLGFSAREIADAMATSPAAVNSALQRARHLIAHELPEVSQQRALAALGDAGQRDLVSRYTAAMRGHDVDGVLALLTEDATWSMPPIPEWFSGREAIAGFLRSGPFTERWDHRATRANGQLAIGAYWWDPARRVHVGYALDVLQVRGERIASVTAFVDFGPRFEAFGLPAEIPG